MSNIKSQFCSLCELMSKVPIRHSLSEKVLSTIIDCAKIRVRTKKCGKYSGCVKLSESTIDNVKHISVHRSCFKDFTRKESRTSSISEPTLTIEQFVSNYIECKLTSDKTSFDMKTITLDYMDLERDISEKTVKKKIKEYILTRNDVCIMRQPVLSQPELVVSKDHVEKIFFNNNNESDTLQEVVLMIRNKILAEPSWRFEGSFENFEISGDLLQIFKLLIGGSNPHQAKSNLISKAASLLIQIFEQIILTDRQARYPSPIARASTETPFGVGFAVDMHKSYRSKKLTMELSEFGLGINYKKLMQIEYDLARSVQKIEDENGGFVAPGWLRSNEFSRVFSIQ